MVTLKIAMLTESMLIGYGISEVADLLSKEMVDLGHEVTMITGRTELPLNGYKVAKLDLPSLRLFNDYWSSHFVTDLRLAIPAMRALKDFDILITFDPMHLVGALAKVVLKLPVIMYYFGIPPIAVLSSLSRRTEALRQRLFWHSSFRFADYLMTNSEHSKGLLPRNLSEKAVVNYHGIDHLTSKIDNVRQDKFKKELMVSEKKLILSIGRFSTPYKGMRDIIEISRKLNARRKDVAFVLLGRNSSAGSFETPRSVRIMTNVPRKFLTECLASCDIYCSTSFWEGFNMPLVAAEANGKPVVAFNVGAHSEVVANGETGFLVGTFREFEDRLEALIEDDAMRKRMGERALQRASIFNWKTCGKRVDKLIKKAASSNA
jgi:glycosyltransferase involved in cell wall biosynthesis